MHKTISNSAERYMALTATLKFSTETNMQYTVAVKIPELKRNKQNLKKTTTLQD